MIDQGGHATRAIVFDECERVIFSAEAAVKTITRNSLEVEHDADDVLRSVYSVLDKVVQSLGVAVSQITQAGLATQRSSMVCWDKKTGKALSPIISWQDRRTNKTIAAYKEHAHFIHEVTGLYLNPHYGATKMRWCLENLPSVKSALGSGNLCVAPLASFILFHLLENKPFVIDPANASRSLLMNYKTLEWQRELLDLFSVPQHILPKIQLTKYTYGHISLNSNGTVSSIPLSICTGDQSAAVFSDGNLPLDDVFVNAGTGAFILKASDVRFDLKQEKLLTSVAYADEKGVTYVVEGTVNGAGRALQWLGEQSNIPDYESHLDEWCARYDEPPVFINAVSGIGSPYWVAEFESYFTRSPIHKTSEPEKFVAVLESIVFLIAENILSIQRISGEVSQVRLAGGFSKNLYFCQKLSTVTKRKVIVSDEPEATAKGVLYLLKGKPQKQNNDYPSVFCPQLTPMLDKRYKHWQTIMRRRFT